MRQCLVYKPVVFRVDMLAHFVRVDCLLVSDGSDHQVNDIHEGLP
jgi:hypothetical protein